VRFMLTFLASVWSNRQLAACAQKTAENLVGGDLAHIRLAESLCDNRPHTGQAYFPDVIAGYISLS